MQPANTMSPQKTKRVVKATPQKDPIEGTLIQTSVENTSIKKEWRRKAVLMGLAFSAVVLLIGIIILIIPLIKDIINEDARKVVYRTKMKVPYEEDSKEEGIAHVDESVNGEETETASIPFLPAQENENNVDYYKAYIEGREITWFLPEAYNLIENHLEFYLEGIEGTDLGNETKEIKVKMKLVEAAYDDLYAFEYDFLVLPMDTSQKPIAKACPSSMILNELGNEVAFPVSLKGSGERYFELFFYVPDSTKEVGVYITNTEKGISSGPVYEIIYTLE